MPLRHRSSRELLGVDECRKRVLLIAASILTSANSHLIYPSNGESHWSRHVTIGPRLSLL